MSTRAPQSERPAPLLSIEQVSHHFGGVYALRNVTLCLDAGQIVGLIGPNGAGKSTLFNLITRVFDVSVGRIAVNGRNLRDIRRSDIIRHGVARVFQNPSLFGSMTVAQNLALARAVGERRLSLGSLFRQLVFRDGPADNRVADTLHRLQLNSLADRVAATLPYGSQRQVEVARGLVTQPKLMLLDEPTAGLNESESNELRVALQRLSTEYGIAMLVVEHNFSFIRKLCPRVIVLNNGQKIADAPTDKVMRDPQVIATYLGDDVC